MPTTPPGSAPPVEMPKAPVDRDPTSSLMSLINQRDANPMDLNLRDQEHAAFSRYMLNQLGPLLGPAVVATSVPAYSAAKAVAQPLGMMQGATPASLREVQAGLSPLSSPLMAQLYTLMRLAGVIR